MLLRSALIDWGAREFSIAGAHLFSLPYEILEQVALVLNQSKDLCLLDNIAQIGNKFLAFTRELGRGFGERLRGDC